MFRHEAQAALYKHIEATHEDTSTMMTKKVYFDLKLIYCHALYLNSNTFKKSEKKT